MNKQETTSKIDKRQHMHFFIQHYYLNIWNRGVPNSLPASPYDIYCGQGATGQDFVRVFQVAPTIVIPPVLRLHKKTKLNSVALVRERTIPTERPPPVGEVSANFCG